jgi:hypothetical protein
MVPEIQTLSGVTPKAQLTASELRNSPDILGLFVDELAKSGVAVEPFVAKLLYLAVTSRVLKQPVSIVVKATSSAGKSFIVGAVLKYFPTSAHYELTSMSEKALIYSKEPLEHRMLVIYEAGGLHGFAAYIVRSLLSEGHIRYETVQSTSEGLESLVIEKAGPTGAIVTTTALSLHPENETRMLSVQVDDSPAQTQAIMLAQARGSTMQPDFLPWHELQNWVATQDTEVHIPFAKELAQAIPPAAVRLRRDFPTLLGLIQAHAILHQSSRERDSQGRIVAHMEDYAAVRELVADLMSQGVGAAVKPKVRQTVGVVASFLSAPDGRQITVDMVGSSLGLDKGSASRRVREAIRDGYLQNQAPENKPYDLRLARPLPEDSAILPTPHALRERLHGCTDFDTATDGIPF